MPPQTPSARPSRAFFHASLAAGLIGLGLYGGHAAVFGPGVDGTIAAWLRGLAREPVSAEVEQVARWAVESGDNAGLPFVVVDKARARLFSFAAGGRLLASTPVLLGTSHGDGPAVPAATPAGRFVAAPWLAPREEGIVWINPYAALWLHGIPSALSPGRSAQRLASDDVEDKRISDGSLHVPGSFFHDHLRSLKGQASVAYVLPEVLPVREVFLSPKRSRDPGFGIAQSPPSHAARRPL